MRTKVNREYEYKVFEKGQFKQFVLKLKEFLDTPQSESGSESELDVSVNFKDGDFESSREVTMDELEDICNIEAFDMLHIFYDFNITQQ